MTTWKSEPACRGTVAPEAFFPVGRRDNAKRIQAVEKVSRICRTCPVRQQCALHALESGADHGVFAGVDLGEAFYRNEEMRIEARTELKLIAEGGR